MVPETQKTVLVGKIIERLEQIICEVAYDVQRTDNKLEILDQNSSLRSQRRNKLPIKPHYEIDP